jgi:hypothetical protein
MLKQSIITTLVAGLLTACGSGGGASAPSPTSAPNNKAQALGVHVTSSYSAGTSSIGDVVDARPFASTTKFTITFTNPYSYSITSVIPSGGNSTSPDFSWKIGNGESGLMGYTIGASYSSGSCSQVSESKPLLAGQSCNAVYYVGLSINFSNNESLVINLPYEYRDPVHGRVMAYGKGYTLPAIALPVVTGIIYTKGQGYDFNGNQVSALLMTTESGQDYMYLNSGQKLKLAYDSNGKATLDFTNNVVPCTNTGCSSGLVPAQLFTINPYTNQIYSGSLANGFNGVIWGLNQGNYGKVGGWDEQTGLQIPNISLIYAVQPDGTIFGRNSNAPYQWGCFNNDGSNFRVINIDATYAAAESQLFDYPDGMSYGYYNRTNWVYTVAGPNAVSPSEMFGKLKASTAGDCTLTQNGALDPSLVHWFQQNSGATGSMNYGRYITQQPIQVTSHGVFGYYIYSEAAPSNIPHFMFYKYPPRE